MTALPEPPVAKYPLLNRKKSLSIPSKMGLPQAASARTPSAKGPLPSKTRLQATRIAAPLPVNLPSRRRENAGLDPNIALVPSGTTGWGTPAHGPVATTPNPDLATRLFEPKAPSNKNPPTSPPVPKPAWAPVGPAKTDILKEFPTAGEAAKEPPKVNKGGVPSSAFEPRVNAVRSEIKWDEMIDDSLDYSAEVLEFGNEKVKVAKSKGDGKDSKSAESATDRRQLASSNEAADENMVVSKQDRFSEDYDRRYPPNRVKLTGDAEKDVPKTFLDRQGQPPGQHSYDSHQRERRDPPRYDNTAHHHYYRDRDSNGPPTYHPPLLQRTQERDPQRFDNGTLHHFHRDSNMPPTYHPHLLQRPHPIDQPSHPSQYPERLQTTHKDIPKHWNTNTPPPHHFPSSDQPSHRERRSSTDRRDRPQYPSSRCEPLQRPVYSILQHGRPTAPHSTPVPYVQAPSTTSSDISHAAPFPTEKSEPHRTPYTLKNGFGPFVDEDKLYMKAAAEAARKRREEEEAVAKQEAERRRQEKLRIFEERDKVKAEAQKASQAASERERVQNVEPGPPQIVVPKEQNNPSVASVPVLTKEQKNSSVAPVPVLPKEKIGVSVAPSKSSPTVDHATTMHERRLDVPVSISDSPSSSKLENYLGHGASSGPTAQKDSKEEFRATNLPPAAFDKVISKIKATLGLTGVSIEDMKHLESQSGLRKPHERFERRPMPRSPTLGEEFEATVSRIVSGDTVMVKSDSFEERRLQLSNIRQPKPKTPHDDEAREFLRQRLVGKTVRVALQYSKPASEGYEAKECATIRVVGGGPEGDVDIAEALVERGLATVIKLNRHRRRSSDYNKLLLAEAKAQKDLKGIHSQKETPLHVEPRDTTEPAIKTKELLSILRRAGRIPAVVERVFNGSKFKVFVKRENALITLVLAGIRAPRYLRNNSDKSEPYGVEAWQYSSRKTFQQPGQTIELEIENIIEKTGEFTGSLWINKTGNLTVKLLEEGLATVHEYSANQSNYSKEIFAAEKSAKAAKKNIWTNYEKADEKAGLQQRKDEGKIGVQQRKDEEKTGVQQEKAEGRTGVQQEKVEVKTGVQQEKAEVRNGIQQEKTEKRAGIQQEKAEKRAGIQQEKAEEKARIQEEKTEENTSPRKPNKEYIDVVVSDIINKGGFLVQVVDKGDHSLERLMSEFNLYHATATGNPSCRPKNGELCSAQFTQDDAWYRAKVRRQVPEKGGVEVVYVDYGNSEVVNFSRVRHLPSQFSTLPQRSHEARLAYLKLPGKETEHGTKSECRFRELVQGKQLVARVEERFNGIMHLTLYDPAVSTRDANATLNAKLVAEGSASINRNYRYTKVDREMINILGDCQQRARKSRIGLWNSTTTSKTDTTETLPKTTTMKIAPAKARPGC